MKNIFKKNQIIITALAIMIVIAGYLSFTQKDIPTSGDNAGLSTGEYDEYTSLEGLDLVTNTGTDQTTVDDGTTTNDGTTVNDGTTGNDAATGNDGATTDDATTTDDTTTPVGVDENTAADELGDISDEDLLQVAQNVKDNGEIESNDDGIVGEAVLASTVLDSGFFISSKLEREQTRAKIKTDLLAIMESTKITEEAKQDAVDQMLELTDNAAKENLTERLLEAKGYDGAMVYIDNGKVDVVVNAASLSDQDLAIIEDVVKRKTELSAQNIEITHVVVED